MGEEQTGMMLEQEKGVSALCQPTEHLEEGKELSGFRFFRKSLRKIFAECLWQRRPGISSEK